MYCKCIFQDANGIIDFISILLFCTNWVSVSFFYQAKFLMLLHLDLEQFCKQSTEILTSRKHRMSKLLKT